MTVTEIENDRLVDRRTDTFLDEDGDDAASFGRSCGRAGGCIYAETLSRSGRHRHRLRRSHRVLPILTAAVITRTPVAHICGGDTTEGAIDEQVRHAVTKMAHLHFPSTRHSAERVLQMGEEPWRVHAVGDPALTTSCGESCLRRRTSCGPWFRSGPHDAPGDLPSRYAGRGKHAPAGRGTGGGPLQGYDGPLVITAPAPDPGNAPIRTAWERLALRRDRRPCSWRASAAIVIAGLMRLVAAGREFIERTDRSCLRAFAGYQHRQSAGGP